MQFVQAKAIPIMNRYLNVCFFFVAVSLGQLSPAQEPETSLTPQQQTELDKADKLNAQVVKLYQQGKYAQAAELAQQVLKIFEAVFGSEHPDMVFALKNLAMAYMSQANYSAAEPLYKRALKITENNVGADHPDTATCLNDLGLAYKGQGNYAAAETLYLRSLRIREKALGPEHPDTSLSLNNLAVLYTRQGNSTAAELLYKRALQINEKVLGPDHPETANCLNNLAKLYQAQGNYAVAEPLYKRALEIREKKFGADSPTTSVSMNTLASLYALQGNFEAAEPLFRRTLKIREKTLGPDHPGTAIALSNLAWIYDEQRNYRDAEPLYRRAFQITEKTSGSDHPETGISLNNLAELYRKQSDSAAAKPLYERALKIKEKSLGLDHPSVALSLNNLALLYESQGNYDAAEPLYQRALKIQEKVLGLEHPDTAASLGNLALLCCSRNDFSKAVTLIDRVRRGQRAHVSRVLPALPAREQEMFIRSNYTNEFNAALTLGLVQAADADTTSMSASWLVNGKGVAQEALAQRNLQTRDLDDPKLAPVVKELLSIRTRLASLAMNAPEAGKEEQRRSELDQLMTQERQLSSQLSGNSGTTSEWVEIAQIQGVLPVDSVLIDIARFNVFDFKAVGDESRWKPARYAAWITLPGADSNSVLIDLGDADAIDELVEKVRLQISADASNTGAIATAGEDTAVTALMKNMSALSDLIWKPLATHVGDARQIILSPDGALWLAPWNALPANDSGTEYLLERYNIRMIISGRDLVATPDGRATTAPVILANPNFDQQESQKKSAIQGIFKTLPPESENVTRSFSAKSTLPKVQPLPNTGIEALAIQPHIETYTKKKAGLYKEQYALERVAKVLRSPQIVTFATHGFFLPTQETKLEDRTLAMGDSTRSVVLDTNGQLIENPLLRCGLLLAGCNNREASVADDDGILTGMEIVSIDFRGTELVVLSACETGIGDVRNGEGVAGLRQAFQLAGAEAVVSTLWQVPDRDSALLMSKFFEELANGKSKSEALRSAQLEHIQKRRDRYGAAHPFYWAAFTLTGE
jgi:CHAT domain-containing protein/tetratricopeptide (TPR) repeat protein